MSALYKLQNSQYYFMLNASTHLKLHFQEFIIFSVLAAPFPNQMHIFSKTPSAIPVIERCFVFCPFGRCLPGLCLKIYDCRLFFTSVRAWRRCWVRARLLCTREEIDGQNSKTLKRMAPQIARAPRSAAAYHYYCYLTTGLRYFLGQLSSSLSLARSCSCLMPDPNDANSIMRESTGRMGPLVFGATCAPRPRPSPDVTVNKLSQPKFARKVVRLNFGAVCLPTRP